MTQALGGVASIRANGELLRVTGSWTINLGNEKRTAKMGSRAQGPLGYTVEAGQPSAEGKLVLGAGSDLDTIMALDDATITIELVSGDVFQMFNAWFAGEASIDTQEGEFSARFECIKSKLVKAA